MLSFRPTYLKMAWRIAAAGLVLWGCGAEKLNLRTTRSTRSDGGTQLAGNGAQSGSHYSLNIIGVPKNKTADMTGSSGRRIFVPLGASSKIMLSEGEFQVLDANGTDGSASFQLPNPDPDGDLVTSYSVYARALGKPGGRSTLTTCATDEELGDVVCSIENLVSVRSSGRQKFSNVSSQLLSMRVDLDGSGSISRDEVFALFSDEYRDYFWQYDNQGLKLLQLRFYDTSSPLF